MTGIKKLVSLITDNKLIFISAILLVLLIVFIAVFSTEKPEQEIPLIIKEGSISDAGSFYQCLVNEGLPNRTIHNVLKTMETVYDVRVCRPRDSYEIISSTTGVFLGIKFYHGLSVYSVYKTTSGYSAAAGKLPMVEKTVGIRGMIKESLWSAMIRQGLSPDLIMRFTDIFSWQVDFLTEPREGDKYKLVWLRYEGKNGKVVDGKILIAEYMGREAGREVGLRFMNGYYNLDGKSMEKQFLKAPLNYRRISSYFSKSRFHPILKRYRPHSGIDYVAPRGTPVVSIGDGTVIGKGYKKASGNYVKVKHNAVYTTQYAHLSKFGKGIRNGVKVKQGQVIGYVGSTGYSTGPHLDFRISKYGKKVNFLKLKIPPNKSIKKAEKAEFEKIKAERLSLMALAFKDTIIPVK